MRFAADTNILVRVITNDDPRQSQIAQDELASAELVVITTSSLCELAWVLRAGYGASRTETALAMRTLVNAQNVAVDQPTVETGIAVLEAGGDFADGAIAAEGESFGADEFVSFDRKAVKRLQDHGMKARLLQ